MGEGTADTASETLGSEKASQDAGHHSYGLGPRISHGLIITPRALANLLFDHGIFTRSTPASAATASPSICLHAQYHGHCHAHGSCCIDYGCPGAVGGAPASTRILSQMPASLWPLKSVTICPRAVKAHPRLAAPIASTVVPLLFEGLRAGCFRKTQVSRCSFNSSLLTDGI
jgi:hypothetical protein